MCNLFIYFYNNTETNNDFKIKTGVLFISWGTNLHCIECRTNEVPVYITL